jgi:hypothetical protein
MRTALWFLALAGVSVPCLIAIIRLVIPRQESPRDDFLASSIGVYIGPYPLELSLARWPAVLVLTGACLLVVGIVYLIPRHAR